MSRIRHINRMYYFPPPNRFRNGIGAELPESYKKFYNEWKIQKPKPVHYIENPKKYEWSDHHGRVLPVQNHALPLRYPKQMHEGIWGGEAVVQGFIKKGRYYRRTPRFWVPKLLRSAVYSEVLDKHMSTLVTRRTIDLIHENYGFDHYLLKTPACDIQSALALAIKRQILIALWDKTLYPDDEEKRDEIYNKYKHYLSSYTREDIEWYGLTYKQAIEKHLWINKWSVQPVPLKHVYRSEIIAKLKAAKIAEAADVEVEKPSGSWLSKINPFSKSPSVE